jgi:hypothetical protein
MDSDQSQSSLSPTTQISHFATGNEQSAVSIHGGQSQTGIRT